MTLQLCQTARRRKRRAFPATMSPADADAEVWDGFTVGKGSDWAPNKDRLYPCACVLASQSPRARLANSEHSALLSVNSARQHSPQPCTHISTENFFKMLTTTNGVIHEIWERWGMDVWNYQTFTVSPDGRFAMAIQDFNGHLKPQIALLDLLYGCKSQIGINFDEEFCPNGIFALNQGSFLLIRDHYKRVVAKCSANLCEAEPVVELQPPEGFAFMGLFRPQLSNNGRFLWLGTWGIEDEHYVCSYDLPDDISTMSALPSRVFRTHGIPKALGVLGDFVYFIVIGDGDQLLYLNRIHQDEVSPDRIIAGPPNTQRIWARRSPLSEEESRENYDSRWLKNWIVFSNRNHFIAFDVKTGRNIEYRHHWENAMIFPVTDDALIIVERPAFIRQCRFIQHLRIRRPESLFTLAVRKATTSSGTRPSGFISHPPPICNKAQCDHFSAHQRHGRAHQAYENSQKRPSRTPAAISKCSLWPFL